MEADIAEGNIGSVGSYDVEFKGGKLIAKAGASKDVISGVSLKVDASIEIGSDAVIDAALAAASKVIDGEADDLLLRKAGELLKALLLKAA